MNTQYTQFRINELRALNTQRTLEGIFIIVLALFVSALLPSILLRYFYADVQLFEQPLVLEYIPVASFAIAAAYSLYIMLGNFARGKQIKQMKEELALTVDIETAADLGTTEEELKELEAIVDEALKQQEASVKTQKSSSAKKNKATKTSKRTAAKKKK